MKNNPIKIVGKKELTSVDNWKILFRYYWESLFLDINRDKEYLSRDRIEDFIAEQINEKRTETIDECLEIVKKYSNNSLALEIFLEIKSLKHDQ